MAIFYNQANLSYNGGSTNSNIVTGEILEVLSATKTAVSRNYRQGDTVTYIVSIINSGNTPFTGLTVTDDLGAYSVGTVNTVPLTYAAGTLNYFSDGVLQSNTVVSSENPLVISGITVPANGNTIIIYSATVNEAAPPMEGSTIVNTATISGERLSAPITATATINAESEPILTISKGINPTTVTGNSRITYTFTIRNVGNREATATDNIIVTDTFAPVLNDITVTINGQPASEGEQYTYDMQTGIFSTVEGVVTVPAAEYTQNSETGEWTVTPGTSVITVSGNI